MTPSDKRFACGFARRHFLLSLVAPVLMRPRAVPTALQAGRKDSQLPIHVTTLNHVSFDCVDLRSSVQWYGRVFGLAVHAFQDYRGGQTVVRIGDGPSYMALSQRNMNRIGQPPNRRPHFCWGVPDFNVDRILRALSEMEAPAQAVLREGKTINGVNFDDPDGVPLQFNPVDACGGSGFLGNVCDTAARAVRPVGAPPPIRVKTLNHVRLMVPNVQRTLDWYLKLTDMKRQKYGEVPILRIGSGPQFVALVEGNGPEAFRPHIGFGVEGFDADEVVTSLAAHGVTARKTLSEGATAGVLLESPDGVNIKLQDVSYCGGRGPLGNICG